MFEFTETIEIRKPASELWRTLVKLEEWWPPSNPEHIGIEVHSDGNPIGLGTEIAFEERVAGVKAKAKGSITGWTPEREAAWEGDATYRYYGIPLHVREGVVWRVEDRGDASRLSANVWAKFPSSMFGRALEWYAKTFLNVVKKDREHARCELEYLKRISESPS